MTWSLATVYGLASTRDGKVRYIGQTCKEYICQRFATHVFQARNGDRTHLYNWIRREWADGFKVFPFVIERGVEYNAAEERWIAWYKRNGVRLVNQTDGGRGHNGYKVSAETRMRQSLAATGKKKNLSQEERARRGAQAIAMTANPEVRKRISLGLIGRKLSAESLAKRTASRRRNGNFGMTLEQRARHSEVIRRSWDKRRSVRVDA